MLVKWTGRYDQGKCKAGFMEGQGSRTGLQMFLSPLQAALVCLSTFTEWGFRRKTWWAWGGGGTQPGGSLRWICSLGSSSISTGRRQAEKRHKGPRGGQVDQRPHSSCGGVVRRAGFLVTHLLTPKDQHPPTPSLHLLSLPPLKPASRMFLS